MRQQQSAQLRTACRGLAWNCEQVSVCWEWVTTTPCRLALRPSPPGSPLRHWLHSPWLLAACQSGGRIGRKGSSLQARVAAVMKDMERSTGLATEFRFQFFPVSCLALTVCLLHLSQASAVDTFSSVEMFPSLLFPLLVCPQPLR